MNYVNMFLRIDYGSLCIVNIFVSAYYLQYKNKRADYVKAIFDIVNWGNVSERFDAASK